MDDFTLRLTGLEDGIKVNIKKATEDIIGIICIGNCPLSSEMEMLLGIKILDRRIRT